MDTGHGHLKAIFTIIRHHLRRRRVGPGSCCSGEASSVEASGTWKWFLLSGHSKMLAATRKMAVGRVFHRFLPVWAF
jgi:hypothetical protein